MDVNVEAAQDLSLTGHQLLLQPIVAWEDYLAPAPLSITIMSDLVFMCSNTDFSINKNPPKDGYEFLRNPDSFHACLMQVCNSGWQAFNEAHSSMDQICLHTAMTPEYLREVLAIQSQGNDEDVRSLLPLRLEMIGKISAECLKLSALPMEKFSNVLGIIKDLLEACFKSKHCYKEEKERVKKAIEKNEKREKLAAEAKRRTKQAAEVLAKELRQDRYNYDKATKSYPGKKERWLQWSAGVFSECFSRQRSGVYSNSITKFRVKQCQAKLEKTQELDEKNREDMKRDEKRLENTSLALSNSRTRETVLKTTIDKLMESLEVMGDVKGKWENMFLFFQMLSNIINISFSSELKDFVVYSGGPTQNLDDNRKTFHWKLLHNVFCRALYTSNLVNMISRTYTEISSKYLMDRVSRLSRLVDMDPSRTDLTSERKKHLQSCKEAEEAIWELVMKNKEEFERTVAQLVTVQTM